MPSSTKPLHEPMLTQIYDIIWHYPEALIGKHYLFHFFNIPKANYKCISGLAHHWFSLWFGTQPQPEIMLNPSCAKFFMGNIKMYLQFISFLHIDMTQVVEILPYLKTRTCVFYTVKIMGADALVTQRARVSATMIMIMLNRNNSVPTW